LLEGCLAKTEVHGQHNFSNVLFFHDHLICSMAVRIHMVS